ncbi:MAG: hydrogen peroxide-inducible genes activator [Gammaproteobacteria bacterium]|jgi:LysR family hydrogen peroxide-inducible transcriptional activator|nr:hydrogen peroxide-inducible genes activator [Gammaproteobacteria bacterium]
MTLTELRYIVAVSQKNHFGKAAQACFVSQPTLSIAIKKLEEELGIRLFERSSKNEIRITEIGQQVIDQAKIVLRQAQILGEIAQQGKDPLAGQFKLGVIYTIGPYLLPSLIPKLRETAPDLKLIIEENFTANLFQSLKQGTLDAIVISYPFDEAGIETAALYQEPFIVALPRNHEWKDRKQIRPEDLASQDLMLLGSGHCFRDQVIEACPNCMSGDSELTRTLEGGSLETIRHMVAAGTGITVLPHTSMLHNQHHESLIETRPFTSPAPCRTVAIAWRKHYPRQEAIATIRNTIQSSPLKGVEIIRSVA